MTHKRPGAPEDNNDLPRALMTLARQIRSVVNDAPAPAGNLSDAAVSVLLGVSGLSEPRLKDLSVVLNVSSAVLSPVVSALVKTGLLTRYADDTDARAARLVVTAMGKKACAASKSRTIELTDRYLEPLTSRQRTLLLELVNILTSHDQDVPKMG